MAEPVVARPSTSAELGESLIHPDAASARMRRRLERPAQVGRYGFAVLGSVTAGAAVALGITAPSPIADAFLAFGGVMLLLAFAQHRLLQRTRAHWPSQAYLWKEGVEIVLENGDVRVAGWEDPRFVLDAYVRPGRDGAEPEVLLGWRMDGKLPLCPITSVGLDRLRAAADAHGLRTTEYRSGGGARAMRGLEFRAPPPAPGRPVGGTRPKRTAS